MNTELKIKCKKMISKFFFFKFLNSGAFGTTMENMGKHRNIKLVTNKGRK